VLTPSRQRRPWWSAGFSCALSGSAPQAAHLPWKSARAPRRSRPHRHRRTDKRPRAAPEHRTHRSAVACQVDVAPGYSHDPDVAPSRRPGVEAGLCSLADQGSRSPTGAAASEAMGGAITEIQRYLAEEVAEDLADGFITRREAIRRLGLLGLTGAAATGLLATFTAGEAAAAGPGAGARRTCQRNPARGQGGARGRRDDVLAADVHRGRSRLLQRHRGPVRSPRCGGGLASHAELVRRRRHRHDH
jgi:hypothetical protein